MAVSSRSSSFDVVLVSSVLFQPKIFVRFPQNGKFFLDKNPVRSLVAIEIIVLSSQFLLEFLLVAMKILVPSSSFHIVVSKNASVRCSRPSFRRKVDFIVVGK